MSPELAKAIDDCLINSVPASLKLAIDEILAKGGTPLQILQTVRRVAHKRDTYTELGIRAYLQCDAEGNYEATATRARKDGAP